MIQLNYLELHTKGTNEIINITSEIQKIVCQSHLVDGHVLIFVPGATGALSTIEYEPGLIEDFPQLMEKLIPQHERYHHNDTWQDGNGHSHLRATLMGPSITIPFAEKKMILGTWQQIIFIEFDNKPHNRRLAVQLMGE